MIAVWPYGPAGCFLFRIGNGLLRWNMQRSDSWKKACFKYHKIKGMSNCQILKPFQVDAVQVLGNGSIFKDFHLTFA